jgi:hypothetical protein
VQPSERQGSVGITWRNTPPTPAQLAAWNRLWTRLLGHDDVAPKKEQPQEDTPGAVDCATVSGGRNLNEDTPNDSRITLHRK